MRFLRRNQIDDLLLCCLFLETTKFLWFLKDDDNVRQNVLYNLGRYSENETQFMDQIYRMYLKYYFAFLFSILLIHTNHHFGCLHTVQCTEKWLTVVGSRRILLNGKVLVRDTCNCKKKYCNLKLDKQILLTLIRIRTCVLIDLFNLISILNHRQVFSS